MFAGISKGGFANGPTFAAAPFLAIVLPPTQAVALMLPMLMVMDAAAMRAYWRQWDWAAARPLLIGAVPGIVAGALVFRLIDGDLVRLVIGLIAVGFVGYQISLSRGWIRLGRGEASAGSGLFWGALCGFGSFVSHAGGPPSAVHLLRCDLGKTAYQATSVLAFAVINALKFAVYAGMGLFSGGAVWAMITLVPFAIAGTLLGVWAHGRVSNALFFKLAYLFLTLTGLKLIFDALT
ncbi:MAG: sulfite exporter TauE/SafE family protein [Pseudomonadota bacterium]